MLLSDLKKRHIDSQVDIPLTVKQKLSLEITKS